MGEIRCIIIAKQCVVAGKLSILDGCLKKSFSLVSRPQKTIYWTPISYRNFPCNLTQFCYKDYLFGYVGGGESGPKFEYIDNFSFIMAYIYHGISVDFGTT